MKYNENDPNQYNVSREVEPGYELSQSENLFKNHLKRKI